VSGIGPKVPAGNVPANPPVKPPVKARSPESVKAPREGAKVPGKTTTGGKVQPAASDTPSRLRKPPLPGKSTVPASSRSRRAGVGNRTDATKPPVVAKSNSPTGAGPAQEALSDRPSATKAPHMTATDPAERTTTVRSDPPDPVGPSGVRRVEPTLMSVLPDGTIRLQHPGGATQQRDSDGTNTFTSPGGSTLMVVPDGALVASLNVRLRITPDSGVEATTPDGYTVTASRGNMTVMAPDRSTSGIRRDGAAWASGNELLRQSAQTASPADLAPVAKGAPRTDIDVVMDETTGAHIAEWTVHTLEGAHVLASTAEVTEFLSEATAHLAGHAGKAAALARGAGIVSKSLGAVGAISLIASSAYHVVRAFTLAKRSPHQQGFVYGVMWQALDEPDHLPAFVDRFSYSADELREAFKQGVAEGRVKGQDPRVRNQIILAVAALGLNSGMGDFYAANKILSQLWRSIREPSPGDSDTDTIRWPVPYDRTILGH
jgi:hypothetical protein